MEQTNRSLVGKSWVGLFTLAFFAVGGLLIAQAVGWLIAQGFGINLANTSLQLLIQEPGNQTALLLMQLAYSGILFVAAPWAFYKMAEPTGLRIDKEGGEHTLPILLVLAAAVVCVYLPTSGFLVELSSNITFPEGLKEIERWMQEQEQSLQRMSNYLTSFDGIPSLLLGLLVIAVIPAVGEELLFRGLIQRYFQNISGNPHLAIIATGFLFSAFHLQFYGLIPRWVLGIMFGYLYHWSGKLSTAMIAHFVNNGVTLVALYLFSQSESEVNLENVGEKISLIHVAVSAVLTTVFIVLFKQKATYQSVN